MVAWRYEISLRVTFDISLVRYRVEHSKRNSISPSALVLFSMYLMLRHMSHMSELRNKRSLKCVILAVFIFLCFDNFTALSPHQLHKYHWLSKHEQL